jgi:hypothetical protein
MKFRPLMLAAFALTVGLAACGGSGGGDDDDGTSIDAPGAIDAPANIDAPAGGGLGQICNQTMTCPSTAMQCLRFSATAPNGYCSLVCAPGQMNMPNAQGQFPRPPTTTDAACVAQFSGSVGTPICGVVLSNTLQPPVPQGQQPQQGTTYTYDAACIITCGTGMACPTGLTCQQGACLP